MVCVCVCTVSHYVYTIAYHRQILLVNRQLGNCPKECQYNHCLPRQMSFSWSLAHIMPAFKPHNTVTVSPDRSLSPGSKLIFCQPSSHTIQSLSPWTEAFFLVFSSYSASLQATQYSHDLPGQKPFPWSLAHILSAFKPHNTVMISLDGSLSPGL